MISSIFTNIKKVIPRSFSAAEGFTLVETLAAVLLLSIALAGPMTIAQKGLQTALTAKDQDTAYNLAQDAVEYIRWARDTNCLTAAAANGCPAGNWLAGSGSGVTSLSNCVSADGSASCTIDDFGGTIAACSGTCSALNYNTNSNEYTYAAVGSGVVTTPFTRTISIKYNPGCSGACNTAEASTTVTISWSDPAQHSIQVNEILYDWQ